MQLSAEVSQTAGTLNPSTYSQTVSPAGAAPVPTIEECGEVWCYFFEGNLQKWHNGPIPTKASSGIRWEYFPLVWALKAC